MADLGNGGHKPPSNKAIGGLSKVPNASESPKPVKPCKQNEVLHDVGVHARWQDTRADVPAVKCKILLGTAVIHPGPLANGVLNKVRLVAGNYEVTLPEVDADEWDFE